MKKADKHISVPQELVKRIEKLCKAEHKKFSIKVCELTEKALDQEEHSNDIEKVTGIARKMVTQWGMSNKMGTMAYGKSQEHVFMGRDFGQTKDYSEQVAYELDIEVKKIIDERYKIAKQILTENKDILEELATSLLEKETINAEEFDELVEKVKERR